MPSYRVEQIRNVVLLSHSGAGKTALSEAMLFSAGVINRLGRVDDGTTTSDYDPDEIKRKISINNSLLPCPWKDHKLNIIDSPGYADFVGETKSAVRVAEAAVVVICAAAGVEVGTEQVWGYLGSLPRLIFMNKMDRENADFPRTLQHIQRRFGLRCVPLQIPLGAESSFQGVVNLLSLKLFGKEGKEEAVPPSLEAEVKERREKLLEAIAETEDELITKYLEGQEMTPDELRRGLKKSLASGKIVPVLIGSAVQNVGVAQLMDAIAEYLPSPLDSGPIKVTNVSTQQPEEIPVDPGAPLSALVFKTTADPHVGKLSYFRVYTGTLRSDSQMWNARKGRAERVGQVYFIRAKTQEPTPEVIAGDIGAVAKLAETGTGDTLCGRDRQVLLPPIQLPEPVLSRAIYPKTKADLDKLSAALARLVDEDATLRVRKETETNEIVLSGMGDAHLDTAAERMQRKFGVEVRVETPKVPYRETITVTIQAEYKHKKQTGGHGQYGHVFLRLEPQPRGSGIEFAEKVVGGAVPRNYIPAVEKGVMEAVQEGVLARYPMVDMKIVLYDGSYHPVDSSDISFKIAAAQALKKGVTQAHPVLTEPIVNLKITVPESCMGDVIGDLNGKRARVLSMLPEDGLSLIEAQAPLAEVLRYATDLRSLTQGRGVYTMSFSHYEEVPAHLTQKIIATRKEEAKA